MSNTIEVRMEGGSLLYVPATVDYCSCGYRSARTKAERERYVQILMGWNLPHDVALDLAKGKIDWHRDGNAVVFRVEAGRMAPRN